MTSQSVHAKDSFGSKGCLIEWAEPDGGHLICGSVQQMVSPVQKTAAVSFITEKGKASGLHGVESSGQGWKAGVLDHLVTCLSERDGLLRPTCLQREMTEAGQRVSRVGRAEAGKDGLVRPLSPGASMSARQSPVAGGWWETVGAAPELLGRPVLVRAYIS